MRDPRFYLVDLTTTNGTRRSWVFRLSDADAWRQGVEARGFVVHHLSLATEAEIAKHRGVDL